MGARFNELTCAQALTLVSEAYVRNYQDELLSKSWIIISEEQYVNREAAELIFEATDRYVGATRSLFHYLAGEGKSWDKHIDALADAFAYGIRAMHLELGLRFLFDAEPALIYDRIRSHASLFASLLERP